MRGNRAWDQLRRLSQRGRGEAVILGAARIVSASCALGIAVASARQLGPSARGEIVLVITVAMLVTELVCLGSDTTGRINILRRRGLGVEGVEDLLGLSIALTLIQGVVVGAVLVVIGEFLGLLQPALIPVGVLVGVSMFQSRMLVSAGFAIRRPLAVAARDVVVGLLPLVAVLALAVNQRLSVQNVLGLTAAGYIAGGSYLWVVVLRRSGAIRIKPRTWFPLLVSGMPVLGSGLFQMVALRADRLIVGLAATTVSLGVYSVAATAAEAPRVLLLAVTQILSNRVATGEIVRTAYFRTITAVVAAHMVCLASVALVGPRILVPIVGSGFKEAKDQILLLVVAEALLGLHLVAVALLTGLAHFRNLPVPSAAGALVVVIGCASFVRGEGGMTAATVRVVAFGVMALISWISLYRQLTRTRT
ncbi:MAG: hypothetical protein VX833_01775 [Actinomycetota bacterium]|nr:hypothetical protein [Actinomycetota bacterium]